MKNLILLVSIVFTYSTFCSELYQQINKIPIKDLYPTKEEIRNLEKRFLKGNVLTIDTRDQETCNKIENELLYNNKITESFCSNDQENPIVSIVQVRKSSSEEIHKLSDKKTRLLKQTRNFVGVGIGVLGMIWVLPPEINNWDKSNVGPKAYKENIKKGPIVDQDHWAVNYIGHPVSGAAYYVVARHEGFSKWESFGYSVFMSTIFWEYGIEAFNEVPSIQDLISTPIIGSLMGELFYQWSLKIKNNGGTIMGSERLGNVALSVLNPADAALNLFNGIFDSKIIAESNTVINYDYLRNQRGEISGQRELQILLEWKY